VAHKDLVIAILGASAALGGLVLVFLGVVITTYQSRANEDTVAHVRTEHWSHWASILALAPFVLGVACVAESTAWLMTENNEDLYIATIVTFFAQLALLLLVAVLVTWWVIWRKFDLTQ
jgi:uncharacterized membrane protein YcjF (UPF0283 family)